MFVHMEISSNITFTTRLLLKPDGIKAMSSLVYFLWLIAVTSGYDLVSENYYP